MNTNRRTALVESSIVMFGLMLGMLLIALMLASHV